MDRTDNADSPGKCMSLEAFAASYRGHIPGAGTVAAGPCSSLRSPADAFPESAGDQRPPLILTPSQKTLITMMSRFLEQDSADVFILKGYAGTGKSTVLALISDYFASLGESGAGFSLFAPTGKAAMVLHQLTGCPRCTTVHRGIYDTPTIRKGSGTTRDFDSGFSADEAARRSQEQGKPELETFVSGEDGMARRKYIVPLRPLPPLPEGRKQTGHMFIFDEASMIGNAYSEMDTFRFGSGCLLDDIMAYTRCGESSGHRNRIIFCGDPAQLFPVKMNMSPALTREYLAEHYQVTAQEYELTDVIRQDAGSSILGNATEIRESIRRGSYLELKITPGRDVTLLTDSIRTGRSNTIPEDILTSPSYDPRIQDEIIRICFAVCGNRVLSSCEFLTFSNREAYEINSRMRQHIFGACAPLLAKKDKLLVVQNTYLQDEIYLANGAFVQVAEILPQHFEVRQHVKLLRRDLPPGSERDLLLTAADQDHVRTDVTLRVQRVHLRKKEPSGSIVDFDCWILLNDLLCDEPELPLHERRALQIYINSHLRNPDHSSQDYLNAVSLREAVRVRYGYAITCHKAQGNEWDNVFLYALSNSRKGSEDLFHWYYTAITRAKKRLFVINPQQISRFSNIKIITPGYDPLDDVRPVIPDLTGAGGRSGPGAGAVPAPSDNAPGQGSGLAQNAPFSRDPGKIPPPAAAPVLEQGDMMRLGIVSRQSLLWWMAEQIHQALHPLGMTLVKATHHQNQERYTVSLPAGGSAELLAYYNKKQEITKCQFLGSPALPPGTAEALAGLTGKIYPRQEVTEAEIHLTEAETEILDKFREVAQGIGGQLTLRQKSGYCLTVTVTRDLPDRLTGRKICEHCRANIYFNSLGAVTKFCTAENNSGALVQDFNTAVGKLTSSC